MALVSYQREGSIATITMDDGKVNVLSLQMLTELNAALDRAIDRSSRGDPHRPRRRVLCGVRSRGAPRGWPECGGHAARRLRAGRADPVVPDTGA